MQRALFLFILFYSCDCLAQRGPGGVSDTTPTSDLAFWWDASATEGYTDGASVNQVPDRSGKQNDLGTSTLNQPNYAAASAGGNALPAFIFDGNSELESDYQGNTNEAMSYLAIVRRDVTVDNQVFLQHGGRNTLGYRDGALRNFVGGQRNSSNTVSPLNTWMIIGKTYGGTATQQIAFFQNGVTQRTVSYPIENQTSNTWFGSQGTGGGTPFTGGIAEMIKFERTIGNSERIIVENYLSAKYSIPLDNNDLYTQDSPAAGEYDHDVAGIGQLTATDRQPSAQGTGPIRINTPSDLDDNEFFLWGSDDGATEFSNTTDVPPGVQARYARVWRVSEVDTFGTAVDVGSVNLTLTDTSPSVAAEEIVLLIDTDGDGSFADEMAIAPEPPGQQNSTNSLYGSINGLSDGMRFTFGRQATSLPVVLSHFSLIPRPNGAVLLFWQTQSERDNDRFIVQRSRDGVHWTKLTQRPGAGNSNTIITYRATDFRPYPGTTYYRLKQVDIDGATTYSDVLSYQTAGAASDALIVYPNPAGNYLYLNGGAPTVQPIYVIGAAGNLQTVPVKAGQDGLRLNLSHLPAGSYFLRVGQQRARFVRR